MAQTSTGVTACNVKFEMDDEAGALLDVSGATNSISLEFSANIGDGVYTLGSKWPLRFECGKDAAFSGSIIYSTAADEAWEAFKDWFFQAEKGARSIRVSSPDANADSDQFDFEGRLESLSWDMEAGSGDPLMVEFSILPTGEVFHNIIGS